MSLRKEQSKSLTYGLWFTPLEDKCDCHTVASLKLPSSRPQYFAISTKLMAAGTVFLDCSINGSPGVLRKDYREVSLEYSGMFEVTKWCKC